MQPIVTNGVAGLLVDLSVCSPIVSPAKMAELIRDVVGDENSDVLKHSILEPCTIDGV